MVNLKPVLWHLLGGTRGGPWRLRMLVALRERPYNVNQLATLLGLDYKTVQHHLRVLVENRILEVHSSAPRVGRGGPGYGAQYHPTGDLEASWGIIDMIAARLAGLQAQAPAAPNQPPPSYPQPETAPRQPDWRLDHE